MKGQDLIRPTGDYNKLYCYQKAEAMFEITFKQEGTGNGKKIPKNGKRCETWGANTMIAPSTWR
jgi:hypothetical protein